MINFENSKFFYDPFPHCVLDDFLEKNIYDQICLEYPNHSFFEEIKGKISDNKFKKYRFSNSIKTNDIFESFIKTTSSTKEFYRYINSDKFVTSLDEFLKKNEVELRLNTNSKINFYTFIKTLFKKKRKIDFEFSSIPIENGHILPHTDGGNKLVGFVIPIIDNDNVLNFENLGTKIYRAKTDKYKFNFYNKTVPFEHAEMIRELPFKKNQMSLHVKTFNSLHGVGPINNKNIKEKLYRKSISIFLLR